MVSSSIASFEVLIEQVDLDDRTGVSVFTQCKYDEGQNLALIFGHESVFVIMTHLT